MARPSAIDIGQGRPLVFLHGWSMDGSLFAGQHALSRQGLRVIIPDLRGHEPGATREETITIADLADDVAALLAEKQLDRAVLIGWSMGATVMFDHARRHGTAGLAGLVSIDMTAMVPNAPDWQLGLSNGQTLAETLAAAERMGPNWTAYAPKIAEALFAPGHDLASEAYRHAARICAAKDGATMAGLWRSLVSADHRATVASLAVPILSIAGAESRLYRPDVGRWIADHAPHGRSIAIPKAGHAPHVEQAEAFNAALMGFAARL
ncbi:alpha/beta hydrolase [Phreatobacter aquaticus]|uniref:Alpha/beta hydrolase n=1 Tax=Phreatobacter aquaticus TaxID=2570229 RepID=A0A4D7QJY4_9HYPH|nr:alpha/beta hydrolase [Phreatobacter aquaticus]QCK84632.1 alpha/beta hydrolase [Phreatobacter aquaticus]